MLLHLNDGRTVEVFRQNCGYFYKDRYGGCYPSINWNIDPIQHVHDESRGFFCIAEWGSPFSYDNQRGEMVYHPEKIKELIPIKNVSYITEVHKWER